MSAVQTCKERGWGTGTRLHSVSWRTDRKITGFEKNFVQLREVEGACRNTHRVLGLPLDTVAVFWECADCHATAPAEATADVGSSGPCVECEGGTAWVVSR